MTFNIHSNLQDKVVIVTGSSSGIGAACATGLAAAGAKVVINYSKSAPAAEKIAAQCQGRALVVQANVAKDADCRRLAQAALDKWGRIDALVNNAGTTKFVAFADLDGLSAEDFHNIYDVNLVGAFQMARACASALKASDSGAIVNISSVAAVKGVGSSIAYAASKGALNALTLALARTLAPQVRVNALCPAFIEGDWLREGMGDAGYEALREGFKQRALLGQTIQPEEVARAVAWLIGGATRTTGEIIMIDSGMVLQKM